MKSPPSSVSFPTGVVAFTQIAAFSPATRQSGPPFNYDVCGGITSDLRSVIFDSDVVFNPAWSFSTATPGLPDHPDLLSVANHEFGHMLGLDHNGIAHTMMFPFGEAGIGLRRQLVPHDLVEISFLYPRQAFWDTTGRVSGKVILDGAGVLASHVVAVDSLTGMPVMDRLGDPDGTYRLVGIPTGTYRILAIPLLDPFTLENYSGWACGYATDPAGCTGLPEGPTDYTGTFY